MIGLNVLGIVAGLVPATTAIHHAVDGPTRARWRSVVFWAAFAATLMVGPWLSDFVNGCLVLVMVAAAASGLRSEPITPVADADKLEGARRLGKRLLLPALCIPVVTLSGTLATPGGEVLGRTVIDPKQVTLVWLAFATMLALGIAFRMTRAPRTAPVVETRRLADSIGWAMILPQMLAALGGIFVAAGVGTVVARGVIATVPLDTPLGAVMIYCIGMALFTIVMGNAFAAFPIMTAGIAIPILIQKFGGNPAPVVALGMLSGFCGTLMTPMAANFNIVPALLLELRDRYGVIRAQMPTALAILGFNIVVMTMFAFP